MTVFSLKPIAHIETPFKEKFGIPRQSLLAPSVTGRLVLGGEFRDPDCVQGLDMVSHLWLSFVFHQHADKGIKMKVRPPRLGGNEAVGVFATRSPFRANLIGLSVVKLESIDTTGQQIVLNVSGVDLLDRTPIIDIKPYLPYVDIVDDAINDLAIESPDLLPVEFSRDVETFLKTEPDNVNLRKILKEILQLDPRPAYQREELNRIYKMRFSELDVHWCYTEKEGFKTISVIEIKSVLG